MIKIYYLLKVYNLNFKVREIFPKNSSSFGIRVSRYQNIITSSIKGIKVSNKSSDHLNTLLIKSSHVTYLILLILKVS